MYTLQYTVVYGVLCTIHTLLCAVHCTKNIFLYIVLYTFLCAVHSTLCCKLSITCACSICFERIGFLNLSFTSTFTKKNTLRIDYIHDEGLKNTVFACVLDPLHFDADPDPLPEIRIRIRPKIDQIPILFSYLFFVIYELIIHVY